MNAGTIDVWFIGNGTLCTGCSLTKITLETSNTSFIISWEWWNDFLQQKDLFGDFSQKQNVFEFYLMKIKKVCKKLSPKVIIRPNVLATKFSFSCKSVTNYRICADCLNGSKLTELELEFNKSWVRINNKLKIQWSNYFPCKTIPSSFLGICSVRIASRKKFTMTLLLVFLLRVFISIGKRLKTQ